MFRVKVFFICTKDFLYDILELYPSAMVAESPDCPTSSRDLNYLKYHKNKKYECKITNSIIAEKFQNLDLIALTTVMYTVPD